MVNLLTGPKGTGKTQQMIELANQNVKAANGNVVFIKKSHRDTFSLDFKIRVVCMADYSSIENTDEYTGFIYGMLSADSDIESIFIDAILKHADINLENMPVFLERLKKISKDFNVDFYVSISADKGDIEKLNMADYKILN